MDTTSKRYGVLKLHEAFSSVRRPGSHILATGLAIGSGDLAFAFAFWIPRGETPMRILQSISAGLLGGRSYAGGWATALVGAALHFCIASAFVLAFYLSARRYPLLTRHPLVTGSGYGLALYLVMHLVVLPLSAAGMPSFDDLSWVASSITVHVAIGIACCLSARRALSPDSTGGMAGPLSARRRAP